MFVGYYFFFNASYFYPVPESVAVFTKSSSIIKCVLGTQTQKAESEGNQTDVYKNQRQTVDRASDKLLLKLINYSCTDDPIRLLQFGQVHGS